MLIVQDVFVQYCDILQDNNIIDSEFEYDDNDYISKIYTPTNDKENISLMFDINTSITYGHVGLLNNLL